MTDQDPIYAQYTANHNEQQQFTSFAISAIALTLAACFYYPILSHTLPIDKVLNLALAMAARLSVGILKRPGGEGSALKTVFGLDRSNMFKGLGADTARRSLGLLKGGSHDVPPGLGNWDNSCYQNSVIQGLASLHSLPQFLGRILSRGLPRDSTNAVLLETVEKLNDPSNNGRQLWLPSTLKSMNTWQQQDAQEYFSKILDQLDKEAVRASQKQGNVRYGLDKASVADELAANETITLSSSTKSPLLSNPLEGMIAQRVGCLKCGYSEGLSLIPFNCLTVPLGSGYRYDVEDCLEEYTKLEHIEGVQCPSCTLLRAQDMLRRIIESGGGSEEVLTDARHRLRIVTDALLEEDFSDNTIVKKCLIPKKNWASSTKSKQAVIARAPQSFVVHINRSMFNEMTGAQLKNTARVQFPLQLDLSSWTLGKASSQHEDVTMEDWSMNPAESMLSNHDELLDSSEGDVASASPQYELRAVVTHFGRHENGHYVCYRKHPDFAPRNAPTESEEFGDITLDEPREAWWRLSDDDVSRVSEDFVLSQEGGVFMLFYERIDHSAPFTEQRTEAMMQPQDSKTDIAEALRAEVAEAALIPLPKGTDEWDSAQTFAEALDPSQIPLPPGLGDSYLAEPNEGQNTEATQIPLPTETDEEEVSLLGENGEQPATVSSSENLSTQAPTDLRSSKQEEDAQFNEDTCTTTAISTPSSSVAKRIKMRTSSGFAVSGREEGPLQSAIRMGTAF